MPLLEDTIATAQKSFGACSSKVLAKVYRYVDPEGASKEQITRSLTNFTQLLVVIVGDYLDAVTVSYAEAGQSAFKRFLL